jgi:hypothetical protein
MTSCDTSPRRMEEPLDAMICWALRERVGDVTPPPGVWGRINERLAHQDSVKRAAWWPGFRLAATAVVSWILALSAIGARAELPHHDIGASAAWQGSPLCLAYQYGILLHRLAVI